MYYNGKEIKKLFPRFYFFKETNECVIDGKKYIFKICTKNSQGQYNLEFFYNDLIVKYICDEISLDCCDIDLINTNKKMGVIVSDYRKDGYNYINGQQILGEYLMYLEENKLIEESLGISVKYPLDENHRLFLINQMNNLETIWDALNYRYRNDQENIKNDKIIKIMSELSKRFCLDYLVMQSDRHERNWEVEEKGNNSSLTPLYDNETSFEWGIINPEMRVEISGMKGINNELEKYLIYSSDYFRNNFLDLFKSLTPQKIEEIITKIEIERGFQFPYIYKRNVIKHYELNYKDILSRIKRINLEEGLKR